MNGKLFNPAVPGVDSPVLPYISGDGYYQKGEATITFKSPITDGQFLVIITGDMLSQ